LALSSLIVLSSKIIKTHNGQQTENENCQW